MPPFVFAHTMRLSGTRAEPHGRGVRCWVASPVDEGPKQAALSWRCGRTALIQASSNVRNSPSDISPEAMANSRWRAFVTLPLIGTL
jgi:hypothetical protein